MLYHPCADPNQVDRLRDVVVHCLRKHVITPYKQLPVDTPFALLSWGCKLMMSSVVPTLALNFIKVRLGSACSLQSLSLMNSFTVLSCCFFCHPFSAVGPFTCPLFP